MLAEISVNQNPFLPSAHWGFQYEAPSLSMECPKKEASLKTLLSPDTRRHLGVWAMAVILAATALMPQVAVAQEATPCIGSIQPFPDGVPNYLRETYDVYPIIDFQGNPTGNYQFVCKKPVPTPENTPRPPTLPTPTPIPQPIVPGPGAIIPPPGTIFTQSEVIQPPVLCTLPHWALNLVNFFGANIPDLPKPCNHDTRLIFKKVSP